MAKGSGMLSQNQTAVMLLAMNTVPLGLVAYTANRAQAGGKPGVQAAAPERANAPILKLDSVVVHLKPDQDETHAERYANVEFDIELEQETDRDAVSRRTSAIREATLAYFSDHTAAELRGAGLGGMKNELLARMNKLLPQRRIHTIYFVQFLVQ
jgi:flagellar basal body-associated protein FliL